MEAGVCNMTWDAQSLSVLEFVLEREGRTFVRQLAEQLRGGAPAAATARAIRPWWMGMGKGFPRTGTCLPGRAGEREESLEINPSNSASWVLFA
jgi:hypothetical protein